MAFKKTMIQRLFSIARCPNPAPSLKPPLRLDPTKMSADPDLGEASWLIRRTIQRRPLHQASSMLPGIRSIPTRHDQLIEKLRGFDIARDRIRFELLIPPPMTAAKAPADPEKIIFTVRDVNKLLRASHLEMMKAHLKGIQKNWVSYLEFVEICKEGCSGDEERAAVMAKLLDDSGAVIVLGNAVWLHPDQEIKPLVVKAIQGLLPLPLSPNDPRRKELEVMEKQKSEMEQEADALVWREVWMGLSYLVAQTAVFMRLTFWELSWDVMEPICFYVTSGYFMGGYTFFLRTSKEPSFEGFYQSRFQAKHKKLMMNHGFDVERYHELSRTCYPHTANNNNIEHRHHRHLSCMEGNTTSFATSQATSGDIVNLSEVRLLRINASSSPNAWAGICSLLY